MCLSETLGQRLRKRREEKGLGLREMARKLDISAAYLSRVETDEEMTPPGEQLLKAIAKVLDESADTLLHLAGRVPADVGKMIKEDPDLPHFLRTAKQRGLTGRQLEALINDVNKKKR